MTQDRSTYIGGSDIASILGLSPWKSALGLYLEKIGEHEEDVTPAKEKLFGRGKRWEPIVVEMLFDELRDRGHEVEIIARNQRYTDPEHPFIAAEIDLELLIDGEEVNGEAKTVNPWAAKAWGDEDSDEIPIYYAAQVMHGLMVKPRLRAVVAALTGFDDRPRIHWIDRDEETISIIRAREIEFWERVQSRNPPDPQTPDDVKLLYRRDSGKVIDADDSLVSLCQQLKDIRVDIKTMETREELIATRIKSAMEDAATMLYMGKPLATWRTQTTNRVDVKALEEAHPDIVKEFRKTSESRVFRLK